MTTNLLIQAADKLVDYPGEAVGVLYHRLEAARFESDLTDFLRSPHAKELRVACNFTIRLTTGTIYAGIGDTRSLENYLFTLCVASPSLSSDKQEQLSALCDDAKAFIAKQTAEDVSA